MCFFLSVVKCFFYYWFYLTNTTSDHRRKLNTTKHSTFLLFFTPWKLLMVWWRCRRSRFLVTEDSILIRCIPVRILLFFPSLNLGADGHVFSALCIPIFCFHTSPRCSPVAVTFLCCHGSIDERETSLQQPNYSRRPYLQPFTQQRARHSSTTNGAYTS